MRSFSCIEECMSYTRMNMEDRIAVTFAKEIFNGVFISALVKPDNDWKEFDFVPPPPPPPPVIESRKKKARWIDALPITCLKELV